MRLGTGGGAAPAAPMDLTSMSSVTHRGVTWTFSAPQQVGFFADGSPCVVAPAGLTISDVSPASAVVNSYQAHGVMRDPAFLTEQGYDGMIAVNGTSATAQALTPYNAAKNLDPAVNGAIVIPPGSRTQLVKSLRKTGATTSDWQIVGSYMVLTILDTVPPKNAFRPAIMDTAKAIWGRTDDLDFSTLRNLPAVAGAPDIATVLAGNYLQPNEPVLGQSVPGPEKLRRFSMEASGPSASPNYAGQYGVTRGDILTALHTSAANATKLPLAIAAVQYGIDVAGSIKAGDLGAAGAGQCHGQAPFLFLAAFMLKSSQLLTYAMTMQSNMTHQQFWVQSSDIGKPVLFPAGASLSNRNHQTYLPEQIGEPAWVTRDVDPWPGFPYGQDPQSDNSQSGARYETVVRVNQPGEIINVGLLQNGPGGVDGCQALLRMGPYDKTNRYAAAIAWLDNVAAAEPYSCYQAGAFPSRIRAMYDARRDLMPVARYQGKPMLFNLGGLTNVASNDRLTAGSGQFSWNLAGVGFASPAATQIDMRYGTDEIDWIVETNVGFSGTKTGLPSGKKLYVQFRLVNAVGTGPWSVNYPYSSTDAERFVVTPSGSPSASAPAAIQTPTLTYRDLPSWLGPHYAVASATLPANIGEVYAGDGFWSGYPYPTISYQWQLNNGGWADIAGETSKSLLLTGGMKGKDVRCQVTATNGSGTLTVSTADSAVPNAAATQAFYAPVGALDTLPKRFTQRWAGTPAITLLRKTATSRPAMQMSVDTGQANRFWSLDDLMPIGDLSAVDEADVFIRWRSTSASGGQGPQVAFCVSGDAATASGYIVWFGNRRFTVYRVVAGTRTQVLLGTQVPDATYNISPNGWDTGVRIRAQKVSGQMQIAARAWGMSEATDDAVGDPEPNIWWETYTDPSPLAAGRIGLAQTQNSSIYNIYGLGLGVGPAAVAPKVPV